MSRGWSMGLLAIALVAGLPTAPRAGRCEPGEASSGKSQALRDAASAAQPAAVPAIRVLVDPRIEVMSIVFRLAGHAEYSMGGIASYASDVDTHFARFRDHPVVVRARQLRKTRGISYNAPMGLAVHLTNPPELSERVGLDPLPPGVDPRWTTFEARAFLVDLRAFVRDANVMGFLAAHDSLYRTATDRLEGLVRDAGIVDWCDRFFGRRNDRAFILVAALLNGGGNYGASARPASASEGGSRIPGGPAVEEIFSILGVASVDDKDLPTFSPQTAPVIVHEFCHAFVNPLVDTHEAELKAAAERIYPLVAESMRSQAYGLPKVMTIESLVRASTLRYISSHAGAEAAKREANREREQGFLWVGRLADTLVEYEGNRAKYPTLDAFMPQVVAFFEDYSRIADKEIAAASAEQRAGLEALAAKAPKVVSMSPPNGAEDVDAASVTTITITFDRPMRERNYAFVPVPQTKVPAVKGAPEFDATRRVLTLRCQLEPDTAYGLQLNSTQFMVFADEQGNPLAPLVYRFRTRK